ncbi:Transposon Ty3-I Gag-Pol poly [Paramuricea clavata]|uniref:Transposon Ty3-I Gag-Pol poly n=1 Tax=Paramuricea clavata TaxID=317549 RepID=A0A6S7J2C0_PARCT|nr:Transposon Ty3-I Gag-Pol poly [Paramuricea clavata]
MADDTIGNMSQVSNIPIPEKFDGGNGPKQGDLWPKWIRRFERYRIASGLNNKSDAEQVSTLLYAMGECADDILKTLQIDEDKASYEEVKSALENHFSDRRNVLVERARFNRRVQRTGEPVDTFIQDLYKIAADCEYGTLKNELIRDRIIVGVVDDSLSDRLQSKPKLTLQEAVQIARQAEERKHNRDVVRGDATKSSDVYYVRNGAQTKGRYHKQNPRSQETKGPHTPPKKSGDKCNWCGHERHDRKVCPARSVTCNKCKKKGHYQAVCQSKPSFSKSVNEVNKSLGEDQVLFLGEINGESNDSWTAQIGVNGHNTKLNGHNTKFKLDTGASVCVLSDSVPWLEGITLEKPQQTLRGPGGSKLKVMGTFMATMKYRQSKVQELVYVIRNQPCSLLSKKVCVQLGLVKLNDVGEVIQSPPDFRKEFPGLFEGLGKLKTEHHITLCDDATPFCLYNPRKVPHPLIPKVEAELQSMLKQNVISPVTVPTEWCSGMVCVPKPNGKVRICVDLTQLNKAVKREIHPMPSVDESLSKLGQGKVFSKLDANSGFWQVPLDEQSRLLTTFITPFGRFCFNRLPFGICSAPEIFQRTMSGILKGLDGTICQMDDVLIGGKDQVQHDERVRAALRRVQDAGLTLNEKCEFSKESIKFLAHVIDDLGIHIDPDKTTAIAKFPTPKNVTELQRFLGMVNHVGKFVPRLADLNEPLRQLLHKDAVWRWEIAHQTAFLRIKEVLMSSEVLARYDPRKETIVAADASAIGVGAVLIQIQEDGDRRPVYYASRTLSETEKRYAVIEKEALAATWACERFSDYITGL